MSKLNVFTPSKLPDFISRVISKNLVPYVTSAPGIGKSSIAEQVADAFNLLFIDIRLSNSDPTDLNGFAAIVNGYATYIPFEMFPTEDTPLPEGKDGWLIHLDELPSAVPAIQAAAYKLILDKKVGQRKLHPRVRITASGNRLEDNAVVYPMGTAIRSRLIHGELKSHLPDWQEWAIGAGVDHRVSSFLEYRPELLNKFDPDTDDDTFPCERTWHFLSELIKGTDVNYKDLPTLAGTIGQGAANEFVSFVKVYAQLPTLDEVLDDPVNARVPDELSAKLAMAGFVSQHADDKNLTPLLTYLERMPPEYIVVALRRIMKKSKTLHSHPAYTQWVRNNSSLLRGAA
jgi:hypothetical protein